jgi:EpsI family protein
MIKFVAAVLILGLNSYVYWYLASEEVIPPRTEFSNLSNEIDGWRCIEREKMDDDVLENLMVTDYIACSYYNAEDKQAVHLYVGYHERQERSDSGRTTLIHPPEHCLPGSGWDIIESSMVDVDYGIPGEAKRVVIAKGQARRLVYFWYQSRGHVIAGNFDRMAYMFIDRATRGRTDGSLIRFTTPIKRGDVEAAEARFHDFAGGILPLLPPYLPN